MIQHPWHEASPGPNPPNEVHALVEIPSGSKAKFEVDKESGLIKLDRVLFASAHYPAHYGFIPQTLGDDKDPLDILVLCSEEVPPLCLVPARVVGVMRMIDRGEGDEKILAVASGDRSFDGIEHVSQLPNSFRAELTHFFSVYKQLEKKEVRVEEPEGPEVAKELILRALDFYKQKFPKK
ncbi:inorganic pyrophosphatase [Leptospira johnsonii]|uniref:Inorganic pyrophosphatase n=1 Tax=Leptospira johnsonii TaxID=1917820 RepID=A0A2P2D6E8_9LEPT|nr:inorganic pyrophosphatase [Leptospira johnsonii]